MRTWKADYDQRLRSTLDSAPTSAPSAATTTGGSIEQSKILKELNLGKKKEEEKGGVL
jgi:hypothetical protein